jgi:hypothetical protein
MPTGTGHTHWPGSIARFSKIDEAIRGAITHVGADQLRFRVIKIAARVASHSKYVNFPLRAHQLVEWRRFIGVCTWDRLTSIRL